MYGDTRQQEPMKITTVWRWGRYDRNTGNTERELYYVWHYADGSTHESLCWPGQHLAHKIENIHWAYERDHGQHA